MSRAGGLPAPRYDHLLRLIDDTGILEHSRYGIPRREHGYTTDDAARALIVLVRSGRELGGATATLASFLLHAIGREGTTHNRLGFDREWQDLAHHGDHHGRAIWALAMVATGDARPEWKAASRDALRSLAVPEDRHLRPHAFAALGASPLWELHPGDEWAGAVMDRAIEVLGGGGGPWPEARLTYCNARLPHALLLLGRAAGAEDLVERGLELLDWLYRVETRTGRYSFTPAGGWSPGEPRPGFDQQPIEAAAMVEAAEAAWRVTGEERWAEAVLDGGRWLLGDNDSGHPLYLPDTGACFDGLTESGVNANQGAESTIAGLAVLQACARVARAGNGGGGRRAVVTAPS